MQAHTFIQAESVQLSIIISKPLVLEGLSTNCPTGSLTSKQNHIKLDTHNDVYRYFLGYVIWLYSRDEAIVTDFAISSLRNVKSCAIMYSNHCLLRHYWHSHFSCTTWYHCEKFVLTHMTSPICHITFTYPHITCMYSWYHCDKTVCTPNTNVDT